MGFGMYVQLVLACVFAFNAFLVAMMLWGEWRDRPQQRRRLVA